MNISREAGNSQSVSYSFYVINLGTGAARIYTNLLLVIKAAGCQYDLYVASGFKTLR